MRKQGTIFIINNMIHMLEMTKWKIEHNDYTDVSDGINTIQFDLNVLKVDLVGEVINFNKGDK